MILHMVTHSFEGTRVSPLRQWLRFRLSEIRSCSEKCGHETSSLDSEVPQTPKYYLLSQCVLHFSLPVHFISFSCSKFILQLRAERSTVHGWFLTHTRSMSGTIGLQYTRDSIGLYTLELLYILGMTQFKYSREVEVCSPFHLLVCFQAGHPVKQSKTEFILRSLLPSPLLHRACVC